jgi:plastocyanin
MNNLERRTVYLLFLLGAASGDSGDRPNPSSEIESPQATSVEVTAQDFAYSPDGIEVDAGAELAMTNRGYSFHDLKVGRSGGTRPGFVRAGDDVAAVGNVLLFVPFGAALNLRGLSLPKSSSWASL